MPIGRDIERGVRRLSKCRAPVFIEGSLISSKKKTIVISNGDEFLEIDRDGIVGMTPANGHTIGVFVEHNAAIWRIKPATAEALVRHSRFRLDEENVAPSPFILREGDPVAGKDGDKLLLTAGRSLEGACKAYSGACAGKGSFPNNCAHFLSDALIGAGYAELNTSLSCVEIRCSHDSTCSNLGDKLNYRVIRAKNLRCWFASKASKNASTVSKNSGFWAVYQERADDGQGHVAIVDTNAWKYYGTGWYSDWAQEYYQW